MNQAFAFARHLYPRLDEEVFVANFLNLTEPLLAQLDSGGAQARPTTDQIESMVFTLFEQSAVLCGKGFLGGPAGSTGLGRYPEFQPGFKKLLHELPALTLAFPRAHLANCGNALLNVLQTPGAKTDVWLQNVVALYKRYFHTTYEPAATEQAKQRGDYENFRRAGTVLAWRAGLAQLRPAALAAIQAACAASDDSTASNDTTDSVQMRARFIMLAALGVPQPENVPAEKATLQLNEILARLERNPWQRPVEKSGAISREQTQAESAQKQGPVLRRPGAFAGFDGIFVRPPEVLWSAHGPIFDDRDNLYLLHADIFGHVFRKVRLDDFENEDLDQTRLSGDAPLELRDGIVIMRGTAGEQRFAAPQLKNARSWTAFGAHTLCATVPTSHMVYVIGFPSR